MDPEFYEWLKCKGYECFESGSIKGRNGVMTIFKQHLKITETLPLKKDYQQWYDQGRFLINTLHIGNSKVALINVYVHQGAETFDGKMLDDISDSNFLGTRYREKINFLNGIYDITSNKVNFILAGDFNVVVNNIDSWHYSQGIKINPNRVNFTPLERQCLNKIMLIGKDHSYALSNDQIYYTWYDYKQVPFNLNKGMKIDYVFISKLIGAISYKRLIDYRTKEYPTSDHIPMLYTLEVS